jgi:hypothetical protein
MEHKELSGYLTHEDCERDIDMITATNPRPGAS